MQPEQAPTSPVHDEAAAAAEDPLRLKVCPRCDYSLAAHPPAGVCPECGRAYDAATVYLYGHAADDKAKAWNAAPPTRGGLACRVVGALVVLGFVFLRFRPDVPTTVILAMSLVGFLLDLWRRYADHGSGLVQVKLGPRGFQQADRQLGPLPYARSDGAAFIPWRKAVRVTLTRVAGDRLHLRITPDNAWWKPRREYVNAVVGCTPAESAALAGRIKEWRAAAGSGP